MDDITGILSAIEQGDPHAAEQLLPLVYDELRKLAAQKMALEKSGQTLQPTALVHEAYLRLVAKGDASARRDAHWSRTPVASSAFATPGDSASSLSQIMSRPSPPRWTPLTCWP
jgi:hypothetical protein